MEHELTIHSLNDAHAICSCGDWSYVLTGATTREEIEAEFKFHSDRFPKQEIIDLTPRGCQTPEGNARVNAALDEWRSWDTGIVNYLSEVFVSDNDQPFTSEHVYILRNLMAQRNVKQELFLRAVAGR